MTNYKIFDCARRCFTVFPGILLYETCRKIKTSWHLR